MPGSAGRSLNVGTTDRIAIPLGLDALRHSGPTDPARIEPGPACALPDQYWNPAQLTGIPTQMQRSFQGGLSPWRTTDSEPELKPYAR